MNFATTMLFYAVIGVAVASAICIHRDRPIGRPTWWKILPAVLFWPFYLPILLQPEAADAQASVERREDGRATERSADDPVTAAIEQVERELQTALTTLDGWAESALRGAPERLDELKTAWKVQALRIRELDELLSASSNVIQVGGEEEVGRVEACERARRENLERLKNIRRQLYRDLMGTLAWVRELVTMIHLARYTGAPASRAQELVTQIAAAVEGLSEVSDWQVEDSGSLVHHL